MRLIRIFLFLFLLFAVSFVSGQVIDNISVCRNVASDNYFRFTYENDFFTATDYYYTQGINLEFVNPALKRNPVAKILLKPATAEVKYGLSVEHDGYTPLSIRHNEILYGDRPFCATLSLKFFTVADDSEKQRRVSSALSIGVLGTAAGGEWMQTTIHKALNNIEPLGWQNQVHTDVLLNYEAGIEKKIFAEKDFLLVSGLVRLNVGTLNDKACAGITFMLGKFSSPFQSSPFASGRWKFHFYDQPLLNAIAYDATFQGGMFNHSSPYTIAASDVERITFQNNFGVVLTTGKIYLEYSQSFLTKEFSSGISHRWGGVRVGVAFDAAGMSN